MSIYDERETAFEARFKQDQEMEFRILVRRDKLFGLWAAQECGLSADSAQLFARSVIDTEIEHHSVVARVGQELTAMGHAKPTPELERKLLEFHELAREQIYKEEEGK